MKPPQAQPFTRPSEKWERIRRDPKNATRKKKPTKEEMGIPPEGFTNVCTAPKRAGIAQIHEKE